MDTVTKRKNMVNGLSSGGGCVKKQSEETNSLKSAPVSGECEAYPSKYKAAETLEIPGSLALHPERGVK
jgi:hypothetical protein